MFKVFFTLTVHNSSAPTALFNFSTLEEEVVLGVKGKRASLDSQTFPIRPGAIRRVISCPQVGLGRGDISSSSTGAPAGVLRGSFRLSLNAELGGKKIQVLQFLKAESPFSFLLAAPFAALAGKKGFYHPGSAEWTHHRQDGSMDPLDAKREKKNQKQTPAPKALVALKS